MSLHDHLLCGPARTLLVIDELVLADIVKLALNHGNYLTRVTRTVTDAAKTVSEWKPHLVVVHMEVAASAILERLAAITPQHFRLPVIALTQRGDLRSKLRAFERGVDDIVAVPFSPEEFVARVLALMRRTYAETVAFSPALRVGDLEVDILNRRVRAGNADLHLTSIEQSLLYLLAANAGRVLTRDEILTQVWGADYVAGSNVVDRHIRNLRVKLQKHSRLPRCIATVPGEGYRLITTT